ncbi:MAG: GAF domain-containing protein [Chloroflexi bacterium]|nr:GAF domain-containing protein [Chloroflexota bacterium]
MKHFPLTGLRARLLLIVLLAIVPAFGLIIYDDLEQRQVAAQAARDHARRIAYIVATDYQALIGAAHQLLINIASLPVTRANNPIACEALFGEILKQYPFYRNLGLINPQAQVACSANSSAPSTLVEGAYFQRLLQDHFVAIGEYEIGSIMGPPSINLGVPLYDAENRLEGALFASLNLQWFNHFAASENLPRDSTFGIVERRNLILTRYPDAGQWTDLRLLDALTLSITENQTTREIHDVDGRRRLYAFVPLKTAGASTELFIGLGIPTEFAYAAVDQRLQRALSVLSVVAIFAAGLAWLYGETFIVAPVRALIAMTARIRAGDLGARGTRHFGEVEQLARAFNAMADSLQTRELERARAETAEREQRAMAEALRDTAAALNSTLDFDQVLDHILDNVGRVVPHDTSNIMLIEGAVARVARCRGYAERHAEQWVFQERFELSRYANIRRVARTDGFPDLIPDTTRYAGWINNPETAWIRSHLGAPIRAKNRVIGILNLDSATPGYFSAAHAIRLQAFADQAAIALENARLLRETARRADEFAALYATAGDLAAPQRSLPILLQAIVERAIALLNTFCCAAFLYDSLDGTLELISQKGLGIALGTRLALNEGLAGRIALTRQPIILDDYSHWEHRAAILGETPLAAALAVPMLYGGELIGVLWVAEMGDSPRKFTDADARLLSLFASQTASAVRNAHLFQETRARAEQLALLYDAGLALNSVLEPRAQLEFLFKIAMQALHAERAEFFRYDSTREQFIYETALGFPDLVQRTLEQWSPTLTLENGMLSWVGRNRVPLYAPDVIADPRWVAIDPAIRAGVWVPVETDKHLLGVLAVFSTRVNAFTPHDERLLVLFANQAAVALENARLFEEAHTSRRALARAYDATIEGWSRALDLRDEETEHPARARVWHHRRRPGTYSPRRVTARHRQDGHSRSHSLQARSVDAGGMENYAKASDVCARMDRRDRVLERGGRDSVLPSRKMGRHRVSARLEGRRDSARRALVRGGGHLGCTAFDASLSPGVVHRTSARAYSFARRHASRSEQRPGFFENDVARGHCNVTRRHFERSEKSRVRRRFLASLEMTTFVPR